MLDTTTECKNIIISDTTFEHWNDRWNVGKNDRKNIRQNLRLNDSQNNTMTEQQNFKHRMEECYNIKHNRQTLECQNVRQNFRTINRMLQRTSE